MPHFPTVLPPSFTKYIKLYYTIVLLLNLTIMVRNTYGVYLDKIQKYILLFELDQQHCFV